MTTKKIIPIVGALSGFFLATMLIQSIDFRAILLGNPLQKAADEINQSCPIVLDSETRLDRVVATDDNEFEYEYTLVNHSEKDLDINLLEQEMKEKILPFVSDSEDMRQFRDLGTIIRFHYSDKEGLYLFSISVSPEDYE